MEYAVKTLQQAIQHFSDAENCRKFMVFMRWPDGVVKCPICDATKVTWLAKAKVYQCYGDHPRKKFSLKTGTVMEDSPIGLDKWLPAMWLLTNSKNGISSYELHRSLGVTQKTAWFMLHRIRLAMVQDHPEKMGGDGCGPIEADEAYIGGDPKNLHRQRPSKRAKYIRDEQGKWVLNPNHERLSGPTGRATKKIPVMGILDRELRQVRAHVIPNVDRQVLQSAILENVSKGSKVFTDSLPAYASLNKMEFIHEAVNHVNEYVRGEVHTNGLENFWALLKRGLNGTYVAVEPFHLDRYVAEQVFRYNNRATKDNPLTDADRFVFAVTQILGKRLTYAELTGKVGETQAL